jgi:transketolase
MPSWELFDEQTDSYKEEVLPSEVRARLAVEAALPQGWERYVGCAGGTLGVMTFGASAPGAEVLKRYGFTVEHVLELALDVLARNAAR